jgi:hypothetical protein
MRGKLGKQAEITPQSNQSRIRIRGIEAGPQASRKVGNGVIDHIRNSLAGSKGTAENLVVPW